MDFTLDLHRAYHKVLSLIIDCCLKPVCAGSTVRKDLSANKKVMAAIEHAIELSSGSVVDMETFQFNYKLFCVVMQKKNLPLPP